MLFFALIPCVAFSNVLVHAWDAAGHEITATLAQIYLHESVLPVICDLLGIHISSHASTEELRTKCHLASVATWADRERGNMKWSSAMHYVNAVDDYPRLRCMYPGEGGWDGDKGINILDATKNVTHILAEWSGAKEGHAGMGNRSISLPQWSMKDDGDVLKRRDLSASGPLEQEAFRFLVHFLGDMHQPLHLTGRNRGGNDIKATFTGQATNLHATWDAHIVNKLLGAVPHNYTRQFWSQPGTALPPTSIIEAALKGSPYRSFIRKILWEGVDNRWRDEIQSWLDCPPPTGIWGNLVGTVQEVFSLFLTPQQITPRRYQRMGVDISPDGPVVCPYAWTKPVHDLNCKFVWPVELGFGKRSLQPMIELDTPSYFGALQEGMVIEKLITAGGLRLAGILNWLFAADGYARVSA
ncbi:phospholipase C/P1 nuclease [Coprinopsis marcescibilis]|uniref:Phospholipase C/P1 nuclease n=1 Tax=Coprinopsis marcescibilis TaxID=230819 RepID=A0A5C3KPR4_COPMA|nr:phospholipase C/P1 nuclease [Coprinopsis marcescibilis]